MSGPDAILNPEQCAAWEKSIGSEMVPIAYELVPLSELIEDSAKKAHVEQALKDYSAEVAVENKKLVDGLVPQDPHHKPPWCKFDPHPPSTAPASHTPKVGNRNREEVVHRFQGHGMCPSVLPPPGVGDDQRVKIGSKLRGR
jgi:hypothetical protein